MPRGRPKSCKAPFKDGEIERKCQLDAGHTGRHGLRPKIVIPSDQFILEDVEDDERGKVRRQRTERDDQQKLVDNMVLTQWKIWDEFGNGAESWAKVPLGGFVKDGKTVYVVRRWKIANRLAEEAVKKLHNASNHEGKKLVLGKIDTESVPGMSRIPFFVITRPANEPAESPAAEAPPEALPPVIKESA